MTPTKPLPKSLHTVTVLANVARLHMKAHALPPAAAMLRALSDLGYATQPDPYSLAAAALAKIEAEELAKFPADAMAEEVRATVILAYSLPAEWSLHDQKMHIAATIREQHGPHFWLQLVRSEAEIYGTAEGEPGDVYPLEQEDGDGYPGRCKATVDGQHDWPRVEEHERCLCTACGADGDA